MKIEISKDLFKKIPQLKIGVNHYTGITVSESPQMLKGRLQLFQEQLYFELDQKPLSDFPGIQEWRETWKTLGGDPTTCPPSVDRLYSRIKEQDYLQSMHTAVDLNSFFSLQYEIPTGIYDLNDLVGNIQLTLGKDDDRYDGLNGRTNELDNILMLRDDYSPFGSPYVDSIRSAVTEETTDALQIIFLKPSMGVEEAQKLTEASGNMFTSISGGESVSYVLYSDQPMIEWTR
ncbi:phenylalanine--tRNA ligase beta subunit-related protein [Sporosarcina oncorhynchi]|uniref:Phenylalanine--tRNA ligase beta subunit-related protein n=1 Tax=Sporosarcina oncorhynchi TaxID=3056444 RepID=A0ABZ0L1W9_9BACL|nr:phenylalanine--tRNA ligase beta subunit-related protein [Sporosarcina sp. T2O-4]WOV86602.1 phenylalanine--tRNA ligase beta subunit-related protein [Sporosarcina sp. T2O-4]